MVNLELRMDTAEIERQKYLAEHANNADADHWAFYHAGHLRLKIETLKGNKMQDETRRKLLNDIADHIVALVFYEGKNRAAEFLREYREFQPSEPLLDGLTITQSYVEEMFKGHNKLYR